MVKNKKILPSLKDLELIRNKIKKIPNRRGEYKRKIHYGCYLLCSESGLRVSEAVRFDLKAKTRKGLYRISKPKGKSKRYVYVSREVVKELRKNNWQPNQTNRWNFYHFLRKIKLEVNISKNVGLTPHNLRRIFATYQAESGMPLPLLSKLLGHSSVRTTALYWQNIYGEDEPNDILAGKKWLENREKEPPLPENSASPIRENFPTQSPRNFEPINKKDKSVISTEKPHNQDNSLLIAEKEKTLAITNYQPKLLVSEIPPKTPEKFSLNTSEQLPLITNKREKPAKEDILLEKIKQLEKELAKVQTENNNLKLENKHLKILIRKDQETEAKILQPLLFKVKN